MTAEEKKLWMNVRKCNSLNRIEKQIIVNLIRWNVDNEPYVLPNEYEFSSYDPRMSFKAFDHMIELGFLKQRECHGVAYEWKDECAMQRLQEYIDKNG